MNRTGGASSQVVETPSDALVLPQGEPHSSPSAQSPENKGGGEEEGQEATGNDAAVAVVTITALIAISILFELVRACGMHAMVSSF
jgi:hypothetical protein